MSLYSLKAFMCSGTHVNNTVGQTAKFLELSDIAMTYSKEKGYYTNNSYGGRMLWSFSSKQGTTPVPLPIGFSTNVHRVIDLVIRTCTAAGGTAPIRSELLMTLQTELAGVVTDLDCGFIDTSGTLFMPRWVSWKALGLAQTDNHVKVWLCDEAFRGEYDEYSITVIPPLPVVNSFLGTTDNIRTALAAYTRPQLMKNIQTAKAGDPETVIAARTFEYVDRLEPTVKISTDWTVLIYGTAGDNPDAIDDAIRKYIDANSTTSMAIWATVFPDLFKTTEFLILPGWWSYAIEQRLPIGAIYSGVLDMTQQLPMMRQWLTRTDALLTPTHLDKAMSSFTHNYRSLGLLFVGGVQNRDDKFQLKDWFPDYVPVPSTSVDFTRMSKPTSGWANALSSAIIAAESWTPASTLSDGLRKTTRNGVDWLVFSQDNVNYLIYPRYSPAYV